MTRPLASPAQLRALPALYSQEDLGLDAVVGMKFFNPTGAGTWYATEYDGEDTFFGLVDLLEQELGYFSLAELQSYRGRFDLGIERDRHWRPCTLREVRSRVRR